MGEEKRPFQFRLRTLFLIVLIAGHVMGAVGWLGVEIMPFVLVAVGILITTRTKARYVLVWLVPSLWSLCAFGSWHHPGDEYGMFAASVLASIWLAFLLDFGHLSEVYLLLIAAGALPMAGFGFILDRLPVSRRLWGLFYITASVTLFTWGLSKYPSLKAAIAKNGSISAYAFCSANLGMYLSVLMFLGIGTIMWLWRYFFPRRLHETTSAPDARDPK